jgi:hypothetical protein
MQSMNACLFYKVSAKQPSIAIRAAYGGLQTGAISAPTTLKKADFEAYFSSLVISYS